MHRSIEKKQKQSSTRKSPLFSNLFGAEKHPTGESALYYFTQIIPSILPSSLAKSKNKIKTPLLCCAVSFPFCSKNASIPRVSPSLYARAQVPLHLSYDATAVVLLLLP